MVIKNSYPSKLHIGNNALKGAAWKILSCACFAGINGIVRYLSGGSAISIPTALPPYVIDFFQNIFALLVLLPWIYKNKIFLLKSPYLWLHACRVIFAVLGVGLWYFSLKYMPIAKALALSFTGPIFTTLGAYFFLKEKLSTKRLIAIVFSFLGAVLLLKPYKIFSNDFALHYYALLPIFSAIMFALSNLLTRKLASLGEKPEVLAGYLLLLMVPLSCFPALLDWATPQATHWGWLILLGLFAALAHFSFSKAYALAEVTFLMPFGFFKFFLSIAIGFAVFNEHPKEWLDWSGMSLIFLSICILQGNLKSILLKSAK